MSGQLGSTASGAPLAFQPSGPGNRTITATALDPQGKSGTATVVLSFNPAPPTVQILTPSANGAQVFAGLPTDLIAEVTNLDGLVPTQPCSAAFWAGFQGSNALFSGLNGCSVQATFSVAGPGIAIVSMSTNGLSGSATRTFTIVNDGKLHAKITSPLKGVDTFAHIQSKVTATITAAVNVASATYSWNISQVDSNGALSQLGPVLAGQSVSFTPPVISDCSSFDTRYRFYLSANDSLGRLANDSVDVLVPNFCNPL